MTLTGGRASSAAAVHNSALAGFHGGASVALVSADSTGTTGGGDAQGTGLAFQLAEDGVLVGEQIPNQSVTVTLIHGKATLCTRPEDAVRQSLSQRSHVLIVGRGQVDEACKVGHNSVKRSNIDETELAERTLQDLDPSLFRGLVSGS